MLYQVLLELVKLQSFVWKSIKLLHLPLSDTSKLLDKGDVLGFSIKL